MENASKALLMAGGILIAILIIGAVTFMFRDVTEAQRTQEESKAMEQINEYNKQFSGYERKLYGHELLSLINKIINTNLKNAEQNKYMNTSSGDGYALINIYVDSTKYKITKRPPQKESDLPSIYTNFFYLKRKISKSKDTGGYGMSEEDFKAIVELKNRINTGSSSDAEKAKRQLNDLLVKYGISDADISDTDIQTYSQYIEFKKTRFQYVKTEYDGKTGRINYIEFKEI